MLLDSLLGHLAEAYRLLLNATGALDAQLKQFYSARRYLGSRDRTWISCQLWPLVRLRLRWQALERAAPPHPLIPEYLCALLFAGHTPGFSLRTALAEASRELTPADLLHIGQRLRDLPTEISETPETSEPAPAVQQLEQLATFAAHELPRLLATAPAASPLATGWPEWLHHALAARTAQLASPASLGEHLGAFWQSAPLDLRINTLKISVHKQTAQFEADGVPFDTGALSPTALRLRERKRVTQWPDYKSGRVEVQDEGSQLVTLALGPQPGGRVWDACAGGGGKALHLAALMRNQGIIYAGDKHPQRLMYLPERARRAGASIIKLLAGGQPLPAACDAVLVDAPCTGLGTLRRHPELLWRVAPGAAENYAQSQLDILLNAAPAVRPGGVLVYATCSFLAAENDAVVADFLKQRPAFVAEPVLPHWRAACAAADFSPAEKLALGATPLGHQLLPALHGCDGFFVSVLRNTSA